MADLLDRAFPASPQERQRIAAQFGPGTCNYRANPDLPGIYAVFTAACEEWRDWRCALLAAAASGAPLTLTAPVSALLTAGPWADPGPTMGSELAESPSPRPELAEERMDLLALRLEQRYCAIEYAVRHGLWPSRRELLGWMRSLTALYFLDKHEVPLHPAAAPDTAPALREALASLKSQGLIAAPPPPGPDGGGPPGDEAPYAITPLGRSFIGELLSETESLIDQYDHYKDAVVDLDRETAEFDTGRGADLRVEAFLTEGVDPIRAVFLLRLYDGTFDHRRRDWQDAIEDEKFYEGILEPAVNRDGAAPEVMELVIESGLSWLEERQEQARREESERRILRQAGEGAP